MDHRRWTLLALLGACTACTTPPPPAPGPATSTVVKAWTRVSHPKSVTKDFRADLCTALSPAQHRDLGLPASPAAAARAEPAGCTWRDERGGTAVRVELDQLSLAQRYDQRPAAVLQVDGYPAVRAEEAAGCVLRIGVSATEALAATASPADACSLAQRVAEQVIRALPEGT